MVIIRRADLHRILLTAADEAGVEVKFGHRLVELGQQEGAGVSARFENESEVSADALIACDGVRSVTRSLVFPEACEPAFLDQADVGGYSQARDLPIPVGRQIMVFGRRAFFGAFRRHDGEIWWFHNGAADLAQRVASNNQEELRDRILRAHARDPQWISEVVRNTQTIHGPWLLHDIATMPHWFRGRVCLVGDAAHACSPSAGQGASLALEDALILARCLRDETTPEEAFGRFVRLRRERVERIVKQSRRNGSSKVPASSVGAWFRDQMLPIFLKLGASAMHEQYGFRAEWTAPTES